MSGARHSLGNREEPGVLAGIGGVQVGVLIGGCAVALACVRRSPSGLGLVLAVAAVGASVAVAFVPAGGTTVADRLPTWAGWVWRSIADGHEWRSPLRGGRPRGGPAPPGLDGVELVRVPLARGSEMGVLADAAAHAATAVLELGCRSLLLDDEDEAGERLGCWAGLLAAVAREGSPVRRLQWLERTVPDGGGEAGEYLCARLASRSGREQVAGYLDLVGSDVVSRLRHRIHLAVQVDAGSDPIACLVAETDRIGRELDERAGIDVVGVLTPAVLGELVRSTYEPARVSPGRAGPHGPPWPWPCGRNGIAFVPTPGCTPCIGPSSGRARP